MASSLADALALAQRHRVRRAEVSAFRALIASPTALGTLAAGQTSSTVTLPAGGRIGLVFNHALPAPVKATGVLTFSGVAVAAQTVTIGTRVYTWRAAPAAAYEVLIGADQDASLTNLTAAINGTGTDGVEYGAGTLSHPLVTGVANTTANTLTLTARAGGRFGNAVATTETGTNTAWGAATLTGGVDSFMLDVSAAQKLYLNPQMAQGAPFVIDRIEERAALKVVRGTNATAGTLSLTVIDGAGRPRTFATVVFS